ncbi:MAG: hypothetical protein KC414_12350, partial [Romboutsia sp.]|nr:hypothetical protein [Romboutsia sp.]
MKTIIKIAMCLSFFLVLSCTKDNEVTPEENQPIQPTETTTYTIKPFQSLWTDKQEIQQVANMHVAGSYEAGNLLYFTTSGKITQLGVFAGEAGKFRVTLWDVTTQSVIRSILIDAPTANNTYCANIDAVDVIANKQYILSTNNKNFEDNTTTTQPYIYKLENGERVYDPIYPITYDK